MTTSHPVPPSSQPVVAMIRGELSTTRRRVYRAMLVVISIGLAALVSLWVTEPGPLPPRLHIAFTALTAICVGWIGVLSWILTRRNCPTIVERLATAWMASCACLLFLVVSVPISLMRGDNQAAMSLGALGGTLTLVAIMMLFNAYNTKAKLESQLSDLES